MTEEKVNNWRSITALLGVANYNIVKEFDGEMLLMEPTDLVVDASYQRNLSRKSINLIKTIVGDWSWSKFKPPIVARVDDFLHIIDGQHTAIAAATHPLITRIPVFVLKDALSLSERADSFLGQNLNRTVVHPSAIFKAKLEAGDEVAIGVNMALRATQVTLDNGLTNFSTVTQTTVGSIASLEAIYKRRGLNGLKVVLKVCKDANIGFVPQYHLLAVDDLLFGKLYSGKFKPSDLSVVIKDYPVNEYIAEIEYQSRETGVIRRKVATTTLAKRYLSTIGA